VLFRSINPATIDLGGSAVGIIKPKTNLVLGDKLKAGDSILLVESSGIHANGITLTRKIAEQLSEGFATKLPDGTTFGEAVLVPTHLYVNLVRQLQNAQLDIHYMVNITGHGWRKLMRANQEFSYVIKEVPLAQPIFEFIAKYSGNDEAEMYGNYNMGAGYAIYLPKEDALKAQKIATKLGFKSWVAGSVEKGPKQVVIEPKNITFKSDALSVR